MKRGQAASEYILVAALLFVILIPATILFMLYMKGSTDELAISKLNKIGNDIVQSAVNVYYLGDPSKITLVETVPEGLLNMTIEKDWEKNINHLVFLVSRQGNPTEMVFVSEVNINGTINRTMLGKGVKNFIVEAKKDTLGIPYVQIRMR